MIRLGLVGVGRWGKNFLSTAEKNKDVSISHICARTATTLNLVHGNYIKTTNYKELLDDGLLDGVIIATPASTHFEIAQYFIQKKIPILLEKPAALNFEDTVKLNHFSKQHNTPVIIGHEYLYNPAFRALQQRLSTFGKVKYIRSQAGNWGPFRSDVNTLWDWGPHDVSMILALLNTLPIEVTGWTDGIEENIVYIKLKYPKSLNAFIQLTRSSKTKTRILEIVGTSQYLMYDELADRKLSHFFLKDYQNRITYPSYASTTPIEEEMKAFIHMIRTREAPNSDIRFAVDVARVLKAVDRSISKNGQTIVV